MLAGPSTVLAPAIATAVLEAIDNRLQQALANPKVPEALLARVAEATGGKVIEFYPGQKLSLEEPEVKFSHDAAPEVWEKVKAKCKAAGVTPIAYGVVGLSPDEAKSRKVFDFAKAMGIRVINTESVDALDGATFDDFSLMHDLYEAARRRALKADVILKDLSERLKGPDPVGKRPPPPKPPAEPTGYEGSDIPF